MCRRPCAYCAVEAGGEVPGSLLVSPPHENRDIIDRIVRSLSTLDTATLSALQYIVEGYDQQPVSVPATPTLKPYLISSQGRIIDAS